MGELSFEKEKIKVLLLEGIDPSAIELFYENGYTDKHHFNQAFMLFRKDGFKEEIVREVFEKIVSISGV